MAYSLNITHFTQAREQLPKRRINTVVFISQLGLYGLLFLLVGY